MRRAAAASTCVVAAAVALLSVTSLAAARELTSMSAEEITALQQRLTDARCYSGAADGTAIHDAQLVIVNGVGGLPPAGLLTRRMFPPSPSGSPTVVTGFATK